MEAVGAGEVRFVVHGSDSTTDDLVSASVFARKLGTLVRALRAADVAVNHGVARHDYKIARLHNSSPTVVLAERRRPKFAADMILESGVMGFDRCLEAIQEGDAGRALSYGQCADQVARLARGAPKQFGYAEVWTGRNRVARIDPFLEERAVAVVRPDKAQPVEPGEWYKGVAYGSFDGRVQVVDTRGALPQIKLVLSAGGKQIDCVCRHEDIETIREALERRVWVEGRAIYDGKSGLPRRVEVSNIRPVSPGEDFSRWSGAFAPFDLPEWEGDEQ